MRRVVFYIYLLISLAGCEMGNGRSWPNDVNGDVFRSLEKHGFDFEKEHLVDINLDFDHWPLTEDELSYVKSLYPTIEIILPDEGEDIGNGVDVGFLQFQVKTKLTYEYIVITQEEITGKISKIGGWCNSWGVLHE